MSNERMRTLRNRLLADEHFRQRVKEIRLQHFGREEPLTFEEWRAMRKDWQDPKDPDEVAIYLTESPRTFQLEEAISALRKARGKGSNWHLWLTDLVILGREDRPIPSYQVMKVDGEGLLLRIWPEWKGYDLCRNGEALEQIRDILRLHPSFPGERVPFKGR